MTDTSVGVREQLLHKQTDRQGYTASEQLAMSDINSTEDTLVNDVASNQDPPSSLHSFTGSKIPGWPDRPLPLTQTRTSPFVSVAIDFVLLIFSLLFLALAAGALAVRGRGIGDNTGSGELIEQASRLGPTVFPIVFAALMSRALKAIGRFKSEKGIEISTLWAFLSTKTVFDAFILQWSFGALSLPTILIGLLWGMSPAGGQASLRILYRTNQTSVSPSTIRYMDTGPLGLLHTYVTLLEGYDMQPNQSTIPFSMTSSFAAALMQDIETKTGPRDSWGNPKIPRIDTLNRSAADENGWIDVSKVPTVESFISLFDLPLLSVPNEGTVEFGIESTYVQLSIASIEKYPVTYNTSLNFQVTCPRCIKDVSDLSLPSVFSGRVAQLLGPPYEQPNTTQLAQQSLTDAGLICFNQPLFGQELNFGTNLSFEATQILVETRMVCEQGSCRATKIRPSATDHRPRNIMVFDFWGVIALDILNQANGINTWGPSMLELFMNETSTIPVYRAGSHGQEEGADSNNLNLANIKLDELSGRATILLNTAVQLLYSYYGFAGGLPSVETTDYGPPHIPSDGVYAAMAAYNVKPDDLRYSFGDKLAPGNSAFVAATTEASVTRHYTIYMADYAWVMVLVISSLALAIMGSVGMVTGLRTRGPDVFDPLMGLTYNNGSLGLPTPGSTLDTSSRAKLLRRMRVRLGDVAGGESVGMVGVGRTSEVIPLTQGRLYE